jgi:hypothetical protein
LIVLLGLIVLAAASASAQDDEAPTVVGPKDLPGADVIVKYGASFELNSTGSSDNVGIVLYGWEITLPDDTVVVYENTAPATPTYDWTPSVWGVHKILAYADDAEPNRGYYVYAVDVVEVIDSQVIANTDVSYDHSIAVTDGSLEFLNTNIEVTGGKKGEGVIVPKGEMLTEDVEYKGIGGGRLAGHWEPYYSGSYYGNVYRDTSKVLTGSASIRNSGGNYHYGFSYHFDQPEDLTDYDTFVFWFQYGYYYGNAGTFYIYSESGYGYYYSYHRGGQYYNRGWTGATYMLNWDDDFGYYWDYGIDWSAITQIRMYIYSYRDPCYIDCAYFAKEEFSDNMTESLTPTGDYAGYWSGFSGTSTNAVFGAYSVYFYYSSSATRQYYYYFSNPTDLSQWNAIRYATYFSGRYYMYQRYLYFYDDQGYYARLYYYPSTNYFHYYASNYGRWYVGSMAMDHGLYYQSSSNFDWTSITRMRFDIYSYYSGNLYLDGFEFYKSQTAGGTGPPTIGEDIPHGVYALEDGTLKMTNSEFTSPEEWGAFVRSDSTMTIKSTSFEGLWGTIHPSIKNDGATYGGILAFNSDVTLDDVTITKASSSGIYAENCNVDASNLDISGHSNLYPMSAGMIVAFTNTQIGDTHTVDITSSDFYNSPAGSGVMVLSQNARGDATVDIDDVYAYKNMLYGVVTEVVGWAGNLTVNVRNSEFEMNGGASPSMRMNPR